MFVPPPSDGPSRETYHRGRKGGPAVVIAAVALAIAWAYVRRRPFRVEIRGDSMSPTLRSGDWAVATRVGAPRRGQILVLEHPDRPGFEVVKRVVGVQGDLAPDGRPIGADRFWVEGDDPARSTDSRHFGPVARDAIRGRVWVVYWPADRWRVLRSRR